MLLTSPVKVMYTQSVEKGAREINTGERRRVKNAVEKGSGWETSKESSM